MSSLSVEPDDLNLVVVEATNTQSGLPPIPEVKRTRNVRQDLIENFDPNCPASPTIRTIEHLIEYEEQSGHEENEPARPFDILDLLAQLMVLASPLEPEPPPDSVWDDFWEQAGVESEVPVEEQHITTHVDSGAAGYSFDPTAPPDPSATSVNNPMMDLGNWFERPVLIFNEAWNVGSGIGLNLKPWSLYFNNPNVGNRLTKFKNFRGTLNLNFLINGSPFHYGRVLCSYLPLPSQTSFIHSRPLIAQDKIAESQRPHVFLDPSTSTGGQLVCPFLYPLDAVSITDNHYIELGELVIKSFGNLRHANAGTDPVRIQILAWMTDVTLSTPTVRDFSNLQPQAGEECTDGEMGMGVISKPASWLASNAGRFNETPYIGKYAMATQVGASAVAKIAGLFGFSRPSTIKPPQHYIPHFYGDIACVNTEDDARKTAADAKQQVSVDPTILGLSPTDEMSIAHICAKESWLSSFKWSTLSFAGVSLYTCEVTPCLYNINEIFGQPNREYHLTPMAHVSQAFNYWRGTIRYRFQIIASQYHRGRIVVYWDPASVGNIGDPEPTLNSNENLIVDISETKDFCVDVGWGNNKQFLRVLPISGRLTPPFVPVDEDDPTITLPPLGQNFANGEIQIKVLNDLTTPNSTADNPVIVNVFVSMHDAEFASPTNELISDFSFLAPQSGIEGSTQGVGLMPQDAPVLATFGTKAPSDPKIFMGETVTSIRALIKRYCFLGHLPIPTQASEVITYTNWDLIAHRGYGFNLLYWSAYNPFAMTFLHYFLPCYTGYRGAIRHKYGLGGPNYANGTIPHTPMTYRRSKYNAFNTFDQQLTGDSDRNSAIRTGRVLRDTGSGAVATNSTYNNVINGEMPFQTASRFYPARLLEPDAAHLEYDQGSGHKITVQYSNSDFTAKYRWLEAWIAAGEDFGMFFWAGVPVMFFDPI